MLRIFHSSFKRETSWIYTLVVLLALRVLIGCTGDSDSPNKSPKEPVRAKTPTTNKTPEQEAAIATETQKNLMEIFVARENSEASTLSSEDEQFFLGMSRNPANGSLEEAVIAVGIVKLTLRENERLDNQAELLDTPSNSAAATDQTRKVSLEALGLEKGLDFGAAIKHNTYLQNLEFYKLCLKALKSSDNSANFSLAINETIASQLRGNGDGSNPSESATQEEISQSVNSGSVPELIADLRSGDNLLLEAQAMAESRRFPEAIARVTQITQENPLYSSAQEKIVEFSDLAVQELRQKAAQAFQNAIPVSDPKARAAYLVKAKSHLEQALAEYPNAPTDQLSTVRENLAVISRDLEKLENSGDTDVP